MSSNKEKLPILDVTDSEERFKSLRQSANRIQDGLVFLGIEYTNKISGTFGSPQNDSYFRLRDSIFFRLNSVIFHLSLLRAVQRNHLDQLKKSPYNSKESTLLLYDGQDQQIQLFDSIVFHAISLFDYLGNLIDYVCNNKGKMDLKWNGVMQSMRDPHNLLSKSPVSLIAKQLHSELVDRLYEHRSDLIHYSTDTGGAQTSRNPMTAESNFIVFAPRRITTKFAELKQLAQTKRLSLNYVAFWTVDKTLDATGKLISPLLEHIDLNRRTARGSEIFLFSNPSKPMPDEPK
jgi:hypothetical protein